jgi:hypothetical protein
LSELGAVYVGVWLIKASEIRDEVISMARSAASGEVTLARWLFLSIRLLKRRREISNGLEEERKCN